MDEPTGDSNGSYKKTSYFSCPDKFGIFVRPKDLQVGDYPPVDDFDEDLDEI